MARTEDVPAAPPAPRGPDVTRYSRTVRWMKVVLPVVALLLIGAIFVVGRGLGTRPSLLSPAEMASLGAGLRLENPRFAGKTEAGEPFLLRARTATPDGAMPERIALDAPDGEITLGDGRMLTGRADSGLMLRRKDQLRLDGAVRIETSDGYRFESERLVLHLSDNRAVSPGAVHGTGPRGTIDAGAMRILGGERGAEQARIFFERRVRVVFIPEPSR